jgi:hypothetical protein
LSANPYKLTTGKSEVAHQILLLCIIPTVFLLKQEKVQFLFFLDVGLFGPRPTRLAEEV